MKSKLIFFHPPLNRNGFTIIELMLSAVLSIIIMGGAASVYIFIIRSWQRMSDRMDVDSDLNIAMSRMIYGMEDLRGIRSARGVSLETNQDGWTLWYVTGSSSTTSNSITYLEPEASLTLDPGAYTMGANITEAAITVQPNHIDVRLEAEKESSEVQREIETKIYWRN